MDEELKQLAALALRNAFWKDFSALVNEYLEAGEGLGDGLENSLGDLTSVYGRDRDEPIDDPVVNIYSKGPTYRDCGHTTIVDALEWSKAHEVYLRGEKVFERVNGEWVFTGDDHGIQKDL